MTVIDASDRHSADRNPGDPTGLAQDEYFADGRAKALALTNRGPIRYAPDGSIDPEIVESYWAHGFYVFTDVIDDEELAEAQADIDSVLSRCPYPTKQSRTDRAGNPALGLDRAIKPWLMAPPLTDPWGGTDVNNGRHPIAMAEPELEVDAPAHVPFMVRGMLDMSEAFLRLYGHPGLLRMAEAVNGSDFTPFNEVLFVKEAGLGPSVAWHQDGQIHWDNPGWNEGIHGFNFQVQLYGSTPANGVWVVPGSHKLGKLDIAALAKESRNPERLPGAVPLVCEAGDVTMVNRQTLHGSFANTSPDRRITVNYGFHRYSSVINQRGKLSGDGNFYDADYVRERCRSIQIAIDARAQRFPHEDPYVYKPFVGHEDDNRWSPGVLVDYDQRDLGI